MQRAFVRAKAECECLMTMEGALLCIIMCIVNSSINFCLAMAYYSTVCRAALQNKPVGLLPEVRCYSFCTCRTFML